MRIHLPRKRYTLLAVAGLLACYVLVLVFWVGRSPAGPSEPFAAKGGTGSSVPTAPSTATAPSSTPTRSALTSLLASQAGQAFLRSLRADHSGLPIRPVRIEVTSDTEIAGIGYLIANGKPPSYDGYWFKSPFVVNTVARSGGLTAFVAAQAGPTSVYITCTLTVDGKLAARHTAHGPHKIVTCLG